MQNTKHERRSTENIQTKAQEDQDLVPKMDIKIVPQQIRDEVCGNKAAIMHSGYLHSHLCKPRVHLRIHATKWTDDRQDLKFFSTMSSCVQQEVDGKLRFHLAAKHAVTQQ